MTLAFDDVGSGPVVLLLHSGAGDRRMWAPRVAALGEEHRVVAPDLPGFGDSPLLPGPNDAVAELVHLLDLLGIARTDVVGSSLGGRTALELAGRAGDRVDRIVLLCPAYPWAPADEEADREAQAFAAEEDRLLEAGRVEEAVELNVRTWLGPEADDASRELLRRMQRRVFEVQLAAATSSTVRTEPDLAAIASDVLVVRGGLDLPLFRLAAAHVAASVPHGRLVDLPWAAHLPSMERPAEITRLLLDALHRT